MKRDAGMVSVGQPARISLPDLIEREDRRRKRARAIRWICAAAGVAAIAALWVGLRPKPLPLEKRFRSAAVTVGDVLRDVQATGHVEAVTTVQVGAEVSGRLATVEADFNDPVKAGQVLARFDRKILNAQLSQAKAAVAAAQAAVAQADVDGQQSVNALIRAERLYRQQLSSDAEYEAAMTAARLAEGRYAAAKAQLGAQQAAYELALTNLSHAEIRAPISGIVVTRNVDPGQTVASAFQTPVLFTVAADLKKMRVLASVDEADIGEVVKGQRATFAVNAYSDRTFAGVVTEVRNSPIVVQDVVTYQAVIEVDNGDLALKPGMTANVKIRTASVAASPRVPAAALRFTPPNEKEQPGLWTIEGGKLAHLAAKPGISDGEWTALVEGPQKGVEVLTELTPEGRKAYGLAH